MSWYYNDKMKNGYWGCKELLGGLRWLEELPIDQLHQDIRGADMGCLNMKVNSSLFIMNVIMTRSYISMTGFVSRKGPNVKSYQCLGV